MAPSPAQAQSTAPTYFDGLISCEYDELDARLQAWPLLMQRNLIETHGYIADHARHTSDFFGHPLVEAITAEMYQDVAALSRHIDGCVSAVTAERTASSLPWAQYALRVELEGLESIRSRANTFYYSTDRFAEEAARAFDREIQANHLRVRETLEEMLWDVLTNPTFAEAHGFASPGERYNRINSLLHYAQDVTNVLEEALRDAFPSQSPRESTPPEASADSAADDTSGD